MIGLQPYCSGVNCPLKISCARYKSDINFKEENHFAFPPFNKEKNKCGFYIGPSQVILMTQLESILKGRGE